MVLGSVSPLKACPELVEGCLEPVLKQLSPLYDALSAASASRDLCRQCEGTHDIRFRRMQGKICLLTLTFYKVLAARCARIL